MNKLIRPKILIVEDEVELHDLFAISLQDNYDCIFAVNLEQLEKQIGSVDAVILDYEIKGHKFNELLAKTHGKPVLVVTGYLDQLFVRQLTKPFLTNELLDQIVLLLQQNHKTSNQLSLGSTFSPGTNVEIVSEVERTTGQVIKEVAPGYFEVRLDLHRDQRPVIFHTSDMKVSE